MAPAGNFLSDAAMTVAWFQLARPGGGCRGVVELGFTWFSDGARWLCAGFHWLPVGGLGGSATETAGFRCAGRREYGVTAQALRGADAAICELSVLPKVSPRLARPDLECGQSCLPRLGKKIRWRLRLFSQAICCRAINAPMIVYVLTNPAMPGLVKIGKTAGDDATGRIAQLYTTGVPLPFNIEFACRVQNEGEVEKALHIAFGPQRINPKRELFRISPEQAIAILKLLHTEEATAKVQAENANIDAESVQAAETFKSRRPNLNFEEMGIPVGSVLESYDDDSTAIVVGPRKVRYREAEMTLTAATRQMLGLDYSVAPGPHWTFQGRRVRDIYNETYPESED